MISTRSPSLKVKLDRMQQPEFEILLMTAETAAERLLRICASIQRMDRLSRLIFLRFLMCCTLVVTARVKCLSETRP
jgi:hypothetical protein